MANPYTNPNTTLTQAASDQELGKRFREQQRVRDLVNQEVGLASQMAYDKGRVDSEAELAQMLYEQVHRLNAGMGGVPNQAPVVTQAEQDAWLANNLPVSDVMPEEARGLSYEAARQRGLVR